MYKKINLLESVIEVDENTLYRDSTTYIIFLTPSSIKFSVPASTADEKPGNLKKLRNYGKLSHTVKLQEYQRCFSVPSLLMVQSEADFINETFRQL